MLPSVVALLLPGSHRLFMSDGTGHRQQRLPPSPPTAFSSPPPTPLCPHQPPCSTLYKLLRCTCLHCFKLRMAGGEVERFRRRLQLLSQGRLVEASDLVVGTSAAAKKAGETARLIAGQLASLD